MLLVDGLLVRTVGILLGRVVGKIVGTMVAEGVAEKESGELEAEAKLIVKMRLTVSTPDEAAMVWLPVVKFESGDQFQDPSTFEVTLPEVLESINKLTTVLPLPVPKKSGRATVTISWLAG